MWFEVKNKTVQRALEALCADRQNDSPEGGENLIRRGSGHARHEDPHRLYPDLLDLYRPFASWFNQSIWLDAAAVARRDPDPTWATAATALWRDFCGWLSDRDLAPAAREQFLVLLQVLGCDIRPIAGEEVVLNIALKEDRQAQQKFENPPPKPS